MRHWAEAHDTRSKVASSGAAPYLDVPCVSGLDCVLAHQSTIEDVEEREECHNARKAFCAARFCSLRASVMTRGAPRRRFLLPPGTSSLAAGTVGARHRASIISEPATHQFRRLPPVVELLPETPSRQIRARRSGIRLTGYIRRHDIDRQ